jgi:uncharacterized integral membrane protein
MKIQGVYIIVLLLSIILVVFALQNASPVELKILSFKFSISLSLLVILSFAVGALLSFLLSLSGFFKMKSEIKKKNRKLQQMKEEKSEPKSFTPGSEVTL